jgi:hypothetical protein
MKPEVKELIDKAVRSLKTAENILKDGEVTLLVQELTMLCSRGSASATKSFLFQSFCSYL